MSTTTLTYPYTSINNQQTSVQNSYNFDNNTSSQYQQPVSKQSVVMNIPYSVPETPITASFNVEFSVNQYVQFSLTVSLPNDPASMLHIAGLLTPYVASGTSFPSAILISSTLNATYGTVTQYIIDLDVTSPYSSIQISPNSTSSIGYTGLIGFSSTTSSISFQLQQNIINDTCGAIFEFTTFPRYSLNNTTTNQTITLAQT